MSKLVCTLLITVFCLQPMVADAAGPQAKTIDRPQYVLYIPSGIDIAKKYPLVIALSPNADTQSLLSAWKGVSEKYKWIIFASKEFRNGSGRTTISKVASLVKAVIEENPVDRTRIIATGLSGGTMGAHALAFFHPELVSAVVANCGMIFQRYRNERWQEYPKGKAVVFLASPTDFRYEDMKRDKVFLEGLGWKTKWIEFKGGHTFAPESAYQEAARWLSGQLKSK